jgi:FixJ family two-component response regulator
MCLCNQVHTFHGGFLRSEHFGCKRLQFCVTRCEVYSARTSSICDAVALGRLLKSAGFGVEKFNHPAAFLSRLDQARCQVAVLDVWMPVMNGLEVQAFLRKNSPETRIIFITARDDPSLRETALDAGALGFLAKPFEDEVLLRLIHEAVAD